jgi:hypothetical protein
VPHSRIVIFPCELINSLKSFLMAKGTDARKSEKKEALLTPKEKKAAKRDKKGKKEY